jgi:hypothetical protein
MAENVGPYGEAELMVVNDVPFAVDIIAESQLQLLVLVKLKAEMTR